METQRRLGVERFDVVAEGTVDLDECSAYDLVGAMYRRRLSTVRLETGALGIRARVDLIASAWSLAYMLERRGDRRGRANAIARANRHASRGAPGSSDPDYSYSIGRIVRQCYVAVGLLPEPIFTPRVSS